MPRVGFAWDPTGTGAGPSVRATASSTTSSRTARAPRRRWRSARCPGRSSISISGAGLNFQNPYARPPVPAANTFVRPSTVFAIDVDAKPPYAQNWNVSVQRSLCDRYLVEVRYVGATGNRLPRNVEANPAVYGPGATAQNADRRRIYANCPADGGTATSRRSRCCATSPARRTTPARPASRGATASGVGFNVSYWFSKSLDYLSAMNLSGAAAKPLAGENDLAQNPFDLEAEHGPSLFDARHRFVASASWEPRLLGRCAGRRARDLRRLAGQRHRRRTTRARRSRCPTPPTCRCRPTARRSRASRRAGRT